MQEACVGQAEEQRISGPDRTAVHPTHQPSCSGLSAVAQPGHCQAQAAAQEDRQAPLCMPAAAAMNQSVRYLSIKQ